MGTVVWKRSRGFAARSAALSLMLLAALLSHTVRADDNSVEPYEEYGQHLRAAQEVAPMADNVFGDQITLYNGATSFEVTDLSVSGNDALPVQVGRRFNIESRWWVAGQLGGFGEWNLEVPYIDAVVTAEKGWVLRGGTPYARCSDNTDVPDTIVSVTAPAAALLNLVYDGTKLHVPGQGAQELLANTQSKSPAYGSRSTYKWVTVNNWRVSCIASIANGYAGEGFAAVSPAGTTYTFNWALVHTVKPVNVGKLIPHSGSVYVDRVRVFLLATKVQDRFGNEVDYHYDGANHLTGITSSDGRSITLNWSGSNIVSVTSPVLGMWNYSYGTDADGNSSLTTVTRPDTSKWIYSNVSGSLAAHKNPECGPFCPGDGVLPPNIHCQSDYGFTPYAKLGSFTYSVTAPSGAKATYAFEYDRHYRTGVPKSCNDGNPNHQYRSDYSFSDGFGILTKQVTGPGLPTQNWSYDTGGVYGDDSGYAPGYFDAGVPNDPNTEVYIPGGGSCSNAAGGNYNVTVTGPVSIIEYEFGRDYGCDEGRLYGSRVRDLNGNVLKVTSSDYLPDTSVASQPFPTIAGSTLLGNNANPTGNRIRPVKQTDITQDGATFTTTVNSYDAFARATSETETGSATRTVTTNYHDDLAHWVLGQISSTSVLGTAVPCTSSTASNTALTVCNIYDSNTALPLKSYAFGKLVSTKAWNADGTLHSITDGNNHATTLSSWYRGLPRTVTYADGRSESAVVNAGGWITSLTDENGFTTSYGYDEMGRLASITYPTGDDVAWNTTSLTFDPYGADMGVPAGHWRQVISTGNERKRVTYDAMWRPLIIQHYDNNNVSGSMTETVIHYDAAGRKIFRSYPVSSVTDYATVNTGIHTSYDALGRVTKVQQDSELGLLSTTTAYLTGFKTKVTKPKQQGTGISTVTSYQAFGQPDTSQPVSIAMPVGATTTIVRDVFGKPKSITRSGSYGGSSVSVKRSFVYDTNQLLCKRIEPETGATLFDYDGAGNLAWSAPGTALNTGTCDRNSVASNQKITNGYDARNRLTSISYPDAVSNTTYAYAADGAMLSASNSNGGSTVRTDYTYDKRRLLIGEALSVPGATTFGVGYGYNTNGHLSTLSYPDGRVISFAPNGLGQPRRPEVMPPA